MFRPRFRHCLIAIAAAAALGSAQAATFRWAGANDLVTFDPHAQNHQTTLAFLQQVYEGLTRYDAKFQIQPGLATKWTEVSPTQLRFELRRNVKFHDGTPFTADDVVFSLKRAMTPPSNMTAYVQSLQDVRKVDDFTVDLILKGPSPVVLRELTDARIMSLAWAQKHNALKAQDYVAKEETYAARNANGTGPFVLKSWQPDVKTVLEANPNWWDKPSGNVTEVVYTPIKSSATRTAALISGQVDFVNDPPTQDLARLAQSPGLKQLDGSENRTIFLGMDQKRDELLYSSVKGKNPLKDKRVRQALYQAVDIDAIHRTTMRKLSLPTGTMIAPMVNGWTKDLEARSAKFDVEASKKLLADAGYPQGFEVTLDCPNDRYVNDEAICQAVTGMWARIGVKVKLATLPTATYFQKILGRDTSIYMLGWGVATMDALYSLDSLISTEDKNRGAAGNYNIGGYSSKDVDGLIAQIKVATDPVKRNQLIHEALQIVKNDYAYVPLHHQIRPWIMRKNIDTVYRADDRPVPWWTTVNAAK